MRNKILQLAVFGLLPFLTGCIDTNDQFTINPDGSGKVIHESKLVSYYSHGVLTSALDKQPSADELKECVRNILEKTKGVDAWKDISYKIQDDGRIDFKGTAYFSDIRELKIDNQGASANEGIVFQATGDRITIELGQTNNKSSSIPAQAMPIPQTEEDIKKAVARQKMQYQQMRGFMAGILTNMKIKESFFLPGQIATMTNFRKNTDGSVGIQMDGASILAYMDRLANDTAYLTQKAKEGKNFADQKSMSGYEANKILYGQEGPIQVQVTGPFKPLFDYESEMQEAKNEYTKTLSDLNIHSNGNSNSNNNILSPSVNPVNTSNSPGTALDNTVGNSNNFILSNSNIMAGSNVSLNLKNGTTIEGKVIEKAKDYVKIEFQGLPLTYYYDEIEKINLGNSSDSK